METYKLSPMPADIHLHMCIQYIASAYAHTHINIHTYFHTHTHIGHTRVGPTGQTLKMDIALSSCMKLSRKAVIPGGFFG